LLLTANEVPPMNNTTRVLLVAAIAVTVGALHFALN
jgi:hypothetical protein